MSKFTETESGQLSMLENPSDSEIADNFSESTDNLSGDVLAPNDDQLPGQQDMFEEVDDIPEDDVTDDEYSAFEKDLVRAGNTAASAGLDLTVNGLESSGLVNSMNDNEAFVKKEIDAFRGIAGQMREMEGNPISQTDVIISQLPNNQDIPDE